MSAFEQLKDKLAYFGGYKWLPYVDAEKLIEDINIKNNHIEMLKKSNREYQMAIETMEEEKEELRLEICRLYDKYCQPK